MASSSPPCRLLPSSSPLPPSLEPCRSSPSAALNATARVAVPRLVAQLTLVHPLRREQLEVGANDTDPARKRQERDVVGSLRAQNSATAPRGPFWRDGASPASPRVRINSKHARLAPYRPCLCLPKLAPASVSKFPVVQAVGPVVMTMGGGDGGDGDAGARRPSDGRSATIATTHRHCASATTATAPQASAVVAAGFLRRSGAALAGIGAGV